MSLINTEILKDKNCLKLFISQLVCSICDKMMSIGLVWYLTKEYSINIVPWFLGVSFLPHLLMAFFSTPLINKLGVLKSVILSEFFRGIVWLVLFGSFYFYKMDGLNLITGLFIAGFLSGFAASIFNPAVLSLPPRLVTADKVGGLNAMIDTSMSISTILGSAFAIFILSFVNLKALIFITAFTFIVAGIIQMGIVPLQLDEEKNKEKDKGVGPIGVLKNHAEIARMLVSFLFLNLIFTPILVMIPWYVQKIYHGNSSSLALIEGALGLGAFLTGIVLSLTHFQIKSPKRIFMIASVSFLFGVFFLLFSFSQTTWHGALVLFFIGVLSTFLNIQILTYLQTEPSLTEKEIPAIMTAVNIISAASVPLSMVFSGLIFPYFDIPSFAKISALLIITIALFIPRFLKVST